MKLCNKGETGTENSHIHTHRPLYPNIGNMGFGSITYPDISDTNYDGNNERTLFLELGIKAALSKNLSFRTDFRFFLDPNEGGDDYYYDEYYDDNSHLIAFAMSAGIQFNF